MSDLPPSSKPPLKAAFWVVIFLPIGFTLLTIALIPGPS